MTHALITLHEQNALCSVISLLIVTLIASCRPRPSTQRMVLLDDIDTILRVEGAWTTT